MSLLLVECLWDRLKQLTKASDTITRQCLSIGSLVFGYSVTTEVMFVHLKQGTLLPHARGSDSTERQAARHPVCNHKK